jgi:two-component sensor histidine kinase
MDLWIKALRDQVSRIADCHYHPDPAAFAGAPDEVTQLSAELDGLADAFAARERSRQAMAHEVHHRVKNNLQIVTSLLKLQSRTIADEACRQPLEQAQIRMSALALIHRLHYEQEDAFTAAGISTDRLLSGLCSQLRSVFQDRTGVELSCQIEGNGLALDTAIPLTLFTVEAVTNAYGHAFPDGRLGTITVDFRRANGSAELCIRDNGVGFDTRSEYRSMGRQLLEAFAHQLGGTLRLESATTTGTVVTLNLPSFD